MSARAVARATRATRQRRIVAISGFTAANRLESGVDGAEVGIATGFGGFALLMFNSVMATSYVMSNHYLGWDVLVDSIRGIKFRCYAGDGSTLVQSPTFYLGLADIWRVIAIGFQLDNAGKLRFYCNRMQAADGLAITGYSPAAFATLRIGVNADGSAAWPNGGFISHSSFRGTLTEAQVFAVMDEARRLHDLPKSIASIATVTAYKRWSAREQYQALAPFTSQAASLGIVEAGGAALATLGVVGALTATSIDPTIDGRRHAGIQGASAVSYFQTTGSPGVMGSAGGFLVPVSLRFDAIPSGTQDIFHRFASGGSPSSGWTVRCSGATVRFYAGIDTAGAAPSSSPYTVTAADVGQPLLFLPQLDVSNQLRMYLKRMGAALVEVGSPVAMGAPYSPYSGLGYPTQLGCWSANASPFTSGAIFQAGAGQRSYTLAEITQIADEWERNGGRLQRTLLDNLWDPTLDVEANGGPSAGVPATMADRVGSISMVRVGSALTVSQRRERLFSYEDSPILYGSDGHTAANYWQGAIDAGMRGQVGGLWWAAVPWIATSQAVASATRIFATYAGGYWFGTTGTNQLLTGRATNQLGAEATAGTQAIAASDLGKIQLSFLWHDGTKLYLANKRSQIGSGATIDGYSVPSGQRLYINYPSLPADGIQVLGFMAGLGSLTVADMHAAYDSFFAEERLVRVPGKTSQLVDLTSLVRANGGALPATATDEIGGANLTRVGAPTLASRFSRAAAA